MTRFALVAFTAALISTSALAQTKTQSDPPLPVNPNTSNATSADDNGVSSSTMPGTAPNGAVRDTTQSGDNGADARQKARTTGQSNPGSSAPASAPSPDPHTGIK
jgi:hypothetical protein